MRAASRWTFSCALALAACGDNLGGDAPDADQPGRHGYRFGPYDLAPGEEHASLCVSVTLGNELPMFVNQVSLTTGDGFHHSNWMWVPESAYAGPDGTWRCRDRNFDEALAAAQGGVLFAQSTQAVAETQAFPPGVAIAIPPRAKLVAGIHLLNAGDAPIATTLDLSLTTLPARELRTQLVGLSLTNQALALPPGRRSSFTVDCDFATLHQRQLDRPLDFDLYWVLPHYHELGRGIELVATGDGGDVPIVSTAGMVGEPLGEQLVPTFSMAGHRGLRFTCRFDNDGDRTVRWGNGDGEMCVMLAFTDSELQWGGGALDDAAGPGEDRGDEVAFHHACELFALVANRW
jgi:hypothetical protein